MIKMLALAGTLAAFMSFSPVAQAKGFQGSGSISVKDMKEKQYPNAAKVTLEEAVTAALDKQKGKAISAELDDKQGFLVYEVTVAAANGKKFEVYVDAGDKKVLGVEEKDMDLVG